MESIISATQRYEAWLAAQTTLVASDIARKHALMAADPFAFLRATCYRWAALWPTLCPGLVAAPVVLAIGDLHIENFGTWRDAESRLVWGVNDFDEATSLPYTNDLVRLAASALLAIDAGQLHLSARDACAALLAGYADSLAARGGPFVLAERNRWLRGVLAVDAHAADRFWKGFDTQPIESPPPSALQALHSLLPEPGLESRIMARSAGKGSLGRQRWVVLASWRGGRIGREIKARVPSVWRWADPAHPPSDDPYQAIIAGAVRAPDPFLRLPAGWVARRLAPDCTKVELADLAALRDEERLLTAMGWETANIHLGSAAALAAVRDDLQRRPARWLRDSAQAMAAATRTDWKTWRRERLVGAVADTAY